ncbi:putative glycolipid-binding domain-containing protein [Arthrobacter halodurans]|uniref:Glycolipid-binding domain-containing protein n=1 Tax=Arthrobacter halodurans TaxID=516699 RepID=A0ABV4UJB6_9MICC
MTTRLLTWSGVDDASRTDHAFVELSGTSLRAVGGTQTNRFSSSWELDVAPGWVTRALRVTTRGFGWSRTLELTRSKAGRWSADTATRGDSALPAPGLDDPESLDGALDCDLGLCPVTNTMPIRRLELLRRAAGDTPLVMAWVEMPSLRILRSEQVYASAAALEGRARVLYKSAGGDFSAHLTIDDEGLVIDYPGLARRT